MGAPPLKFKMWKPWNDRDLGDNDPNTSASGGPTPRSASQKPRKTAHSFRNGECIVHLEVREPNKVLEALGLESALVDWARHQADLADAWQRCDRGDWLLRIATRVAVPRRLVVQAAIDCAGISLGRIPRSEFRPRRALHLASAWVRGEATGSECWAHGFASANAAGEADDPQVTDAAMGAACAAFACDADADDTYYAQRAYAAQAAFLSACAFHDEVLRAHRLTASIVRDRVPFSHVAHRIDDAVHDSVLPPPGPATHEDALYAFAMGHGNG